MAKTINQFPEIVTYRITSDCTQNCRYCYGPKNIPALNLKGIKKIFKLFSEKGVKAVVLTGGEPLIRNDIDKILKELKKLKIKIYLDTNGDLFFNYKKSINQSINILGLPLDNFHESAPYRSKNNFKHVLKILDYYKKLKRKKPKIKIGTVVTQENINSLLNIAELLKDYPIDYWKIYQFIPIGKTARKNKNELIVENQKYLNKVNKVLAKYGHFFEIIISPREERAKAYFLINPDGSIIMPTDNGIKCQEKNIGHVFDKNIIEKWQQQVTERNYIGNVKTTFSHSWKSFPMKPIYNEIWQKAKRYNSKGQAYTADHVEWHIQEALSIIKNEKVDETIFIPFIILHDIGYFEVDKQSPFVKKVRKIHMQAGKEISKKILRNVLYPIDKIEKISSYVAMHDIWALGDNREYQKDNVLGIFNDLDFISMLSKGGFSAMAEFLKKDKQKLFNYLANDEKLINRPFSTNTTKNLYQKYFNYKKQELFVD